MIEQFVRSRAKFRKGITYFLVDSERVQCGFHSLPLHGRVRTQFFQCLDGFRVTFQPGEPLSKDSPPLPNDCPGRFFLLQQRLRNSPEAELKIAAEEQRKITRLRLHKLVSQ